MESSFPFAQIDFSQPITSTILGNRNKGKEEAFSSDQSAIAVTETHNMGTGSVTAFFT